jgi:hypothetical protein
LHAARQLPAWLIFDVGQKEGTSMGICLGIVRLSDAAIDEISAAPKKALHFWMQDDTPEPAPVGWLGHLFGRKEEGIQRCSVSREPGDEADLDKAWDAIDYLLSDGRKTEGISRFLTEGGDVVLEEFGYGPPRVIRSAQVKEIDAFLRDVGADVLRARYEPETMDRAKVYPQIWARDGEEGFEYIVGYFEPLRSFVHEAALRGMGMMITFA